MVSLVLTLAGSAAGNALLPGIGGAILGGIGAVLGSSLDTALFGATTIKGPRLESVKIHDSAYGNAIPILYGRLRVAGNVIWAGDLTETLNSEDVGGKGGASSATVQRAHYSIDCAMSLGEGPVGAVKTIWADGKVIYSDGAWKEGVIADAEFYLGATTQNPSPLMESHLGIGMVPAYRRLAYVVLHQLQLGPFGNRLPNLTFEIAPAGNTLRPSWQGEVAPGIIGRTDSYATPAALAPLVLARRGETVTRILVGGLANSGSTYQFTALEYDVTGAAPVELARTSSAIFTTTANLTDIAWAMAPDGQSVIFYCQHDGATKPISLALYGVVARSFGTVLADNLGEATAQGMVAWLDNQHVVLLDTQGGKRGVRVYLVAGLSTVLLGFYDVWGTGSSTTRYRLSFAQFAPLPGGLLQAMGNGSTTPTILYGRTLHWANNTLQVGAEYVIDNALSAPVTISYSYFIPLENGEVVLARLGVSQFRLFSFLPSYAGYTQTRAWQAFSVSPSGYLSLARRGGNLCFLQQGFSGSIYRYGEIALDAGAFTLSATAQIISGSYNGSGANYFTPFPISRTCMALLAGGSSNTLLKVALFERTPPVHDLAAMVEDILARAGYEGADYDLSALSSGVVEGYAVADVASARHALEPLQIAHGFALVESDGVLKVKTHSASADETIRIAETSATHEGQEPPPTATRTRAQEQDVPAEITLQHLDPSLDFQRGSQRARRLASAARGVESLNLPLVCGADVAKRVAEIQLYQRWAERETITLPLARAHAALDVGDVIALDDEKLRITTLTQEGGLLRLDAVPAVAETLASTARADGGDGLSRRATVPIESLCHALDLPPLRAEDDQPLYYAGLSGVAGWPGGALYRSADNSAFALQGSFTQPLVCGVVANVLLVASTHYLDRANSLTVALLRGSLASSSMTDFFNGANAALVGDEIIQFQNAQLNADGSYTLSVLQRGLRGTESAVDAHVLGERFVLLQSASLRALPLTLSDRARGFYVKGISTGQVVDDRPSAHFTPQLKTLQPFAPCHAQGVRVSSGDITLSWVRRARLNAAWVDGVDVPLDESTELYDVEIYNGTTLVRTFNNVVMPSQLYSAAQQATDFGAAQTSFPVKIYQISSRYGRGAALSATIHT